MDSEHRESIIELLVNARADLNCPGRSDNIDHVRPLHIAAMWGYDLTVKLLLYHGADASLRDSNNYSPIDYATIFDNYKCMSLLLRYGSLNSTTAAWSALIDTSVDGSTTGSSVDNTCLYTTALDNNSIDNERSSTNTLQDSIDGNNNIQQVNIYESDENDNDDDDDEYDPLEHIRDDEIDVHMDNQRLRLELRRLGRNPGPITGTTKRVYAKLLAHLAKQDKALVYTPKTKTKALQNGYSVELNSILTGRFLFKQALELEKEFICISGTRDYHGPKQFFNYILIDPRISQNLPEQVMDASDSDNSGNPLKSPGSTAANGAESAQGKGGGDAEHVSRDRVEPAKHAMSRMNRKFNPKMFARFIESVFYIGKGQKSRDFMHLYDALVGRDSITRRKIDTIRSIWADGYGVVSLHLFHNITSKEALTREALMIETIGLDNLTNVLRGTIQFKLGWNERKRRQLGALLLLRAYNQFINEGERQLKRDDLKTSRTHHIVIE